MVVFTGSTDTAKVIEKAIAQSAKPQAPLIAETGGINAMIVDSSALLERAVDDILTSAFRSAGQRCSALRMLYIQNDIAERLIRMLGEAAAAMTVGHAANMDTDIGPVIDTKAKARIDQHIERGTPDRAVNLAGGCN
jgi:RHH-type proline utilization regulon transcriptional repressor/proline dehydrogenase/delta 1-pyrroline-5-carboxylate dehydrogenase